jgi:hypothetical protein
MGFFGLKTLTEKKELEFGLHHTNKDNRSNFIGVFGDQIDPTQGFIGEPSEIHKNYKYLCLPIKINIFITEKSYFKIGYQAEILIDANTKVREENDKRKNKVENIKPFNASVFFGFW